MIQWKPTGTFSDSDIASVQPKLGHSEEVSMATERDLISGIRQMYDRKLAALSRQILEPNDVHRKAGRRSRRPCLVARSLLDTNIEVRLVGSSVALDRITEPAGSYPADSVLICTSVRSCQARTGRPAELSPTEANAWGLALVPAGFEEFGLRLGRVTDSLSAAHHYRFVLGPDRAICVISPMDQQAFANALH